MSVASKEDVKKAKALCADTKATYDRVWDTHVRALDVLRSSLRARELEQWKRVHCLHNLEAIHELGEAVHLKFVVRDVAKSDGTLHVHWSTQSGDYIWVSLKHHAPYALEKRHIGRRQVSKHESGHFRHIVGFLLPQIRSAYESWEVIKEIDGKVEKKVNKYE